MSDYPLNEPPVGALPDLAGRLALLECRMGEMAATLERVAQTVKDLRAQVAALQDGDLGEGE